MKLVGLPLLNLILVTLAPAAGVINWVTTKGDTGYSGGSEATNSPVTTHANGDTLVGSFPAVPLAVGDTIELSGSVTITGNTGAVPSSQFRWGIFDTCSNQFITPGRRNEDRRFSRKGHP